MNQFNVLILAFSLFVCDGCSSSNNSESREESIIGIWKAEITPEIAADLGQSLEELEKSYVELEFYEDGSITVGAIDPVTIGTVEPHIMNGDYSVSNSILRMSFVSGIEEHQKIKIKNNRMYLIPREFDGKVTNILVRIREPFFKKDRANH